MNNRAPLSAVERLAVRYRTLIAILILLPMASSCRKAEPRLDAAWSRPERFASSKEALNSSFGLVALNGEPVGVDGSSFYFLGTSGTNWTQKTFSQAAEIKYPRLLADPASSQFVLYHGEVEGGKLHIYKKTHSEVLPGKLISTFAFCTMHPTMGIENMHVRHLALGAGELFGDVKRSSEEQPVEPIWRQQYGPPLITPSMGWLGAGVILGEDVYIPYMVECSAFYGSQHQIGGSGPWQTGLLHSTGDHSQWTRVQLFDAYTLGQSVFATRGNLYCFAHRLGEKDRKVWGLWCSRISRAEGSRPDPELVAPKCCTTTYAAYSAATDGERIHLVWLDERHESYSTLRVLRTGGPAGATKFEIYYRGRKDDESGWTKEILLSREPRFAFAPEMAVEGEKIVVVWAGYSSGYGEFCPSDIYFTTSHDAGRSWMAPVRVTDNAKSRLVSGRPQVALHNGVIHLFYIQGKLEERNVGAGLRLLNQEPWAIMYQHRAFPE